HRVAACVSYRTLKRSGVLLWGNFQNDALELSPKSAFFGFLKVGDKATRTIRLTSRSGSVFKATKVFVFLPDPKIVDVAIGGRPKEGIYDFTLTVNTSEKRFVDTKVTISTDDPGYGAGRVMSLECGGRAERRHRFGSFGDIAELKRCRRSALPPHSIGRGRRHG
ncbi:MAG: hypothetical protein COS85_18055, partial [Armatimonadetes bacterium CG07_land_8_20_14_0_80_59_28]